jgi:hypothetical protein
MSKQRQREREKGRDHSKLLLRVLSALFLLFIASSHRNQTRGFIPSHLFFYSLLYILVPLAGRRQFLLRRRQRLCQSSRAHSRRIPLVKSASTRFGPSGVKLLLGLIVVSTSGQGHTDIVRHALIVDANRFVTGGDDGTGKPTRGSIFRPSSDQVFLSLFFSSSSFSSFPPPLQEESLCGKAPRVAACLSWKVQACLHAPVPRTHSHLLPFPGHTGPITSMLLLSGREGLRLLTGSSDKSLRVSSTPHLLHLLLLLKKKEREIE